jgi:hypothetical protein
MSVPGGEVRDWDGRRKSEAAEYLKAARIASVLRRRSRPCAGQKVTQKTQISIKSVVDLE